MRQESGIRFSHGAAALTTAGVLLVGCGGGGGSAGDVDQSSQPRVAMDANGRAPMRCAPGGGCTAPVFATPHALDRELGIDDQGTAQRVYVAVDRWPDPTSTEISVYTRQMPWGQPWGPQALLETQPGGIKSGLAVSFNRASSAVATWAQNDSVSGARNSLWASVRR